MQPLRHRYLQQTTKTHINLHSSTDCHIDSTSHNSPKCEGHNARRIPANVRFTVRTLGAKKANRQKEYIFDIL